MGKIMEYFNFCHEFSFEMLIVGNDESNGFFAFLEFNFLGVFWSSF